MCDYCRVKDEDAPMLSHRELKGDVYEGLEMTVDDNSLCVCVVAPIKIGYVVAHTVYEKKVGINYCPMCGRKLAGI